MVNIELFNDLQRSASKKDVGLYYYAMFKLRAFFIMIYALMLAAYVKTRRNITKLKIPPVETTILVPSVMISHINTWTEKWIKTLLFHTRHKCYYRAYVLIFILRRCGIEVQFNIGLRNLSTIDKDRGHCWLTFKGEPILIDDEYVRHIYPYKIMEQMDGITFWVGLNDGKSIKRLKKE